MIVNGHCVACGDFVRIDHRTGLCDWCEDETDHITDPLWEHANSFLSGHPAARREADAA
ncbi:hypothetical protein ACIU1J_01780 [Azospirillum doebereinerae]|uniref:hypothetical protein n=1 Tax=Azospirillum doebereinerae TaxID=92933 RepID=UPI001EE4FF6C|nr:hypothetical protein [Azospirillum doebereinerae]MCG5240061.1 hypothetical protein [Azospirillum doebereinerae]